MVTVTEGMHSHAGAWERGNFGDHHGSRTGSGDILNEYLLALLILFCSNRFALKRPALNNLPHLKDVSINSDFFVTGFCSCKTGIRPPWMVEVQITQEQVICLPPWMVEVQITQERLFARASCT